jgi:hypothetical protein
VTGLSKISHKGYTWEHNPATLRITKEHSVSTRQLSGGDTSVRVFGTKCRVITGSGQLLGEDCLYRFVEMLELQSEKDSGILCLPDMKPMYAFFKSLELSCKPTPDVLTYCFEFVEDCSKNNSEKEKYYHMMINGETLWDIAYLCGVEIEKLVELNPDIARVDELEEGQMVRIC